MLTVYGLRLSEVFRVRKKAEIVEFRVPKSYFLFGTRVSIMLSTVSTDFFSGLCTVKGRKYSTTINYTVLLCAINRLNS